MSSTFRQIIFGAAVLAACLLGVQASAQEQAPAWHQEREKLKRVIEERVAKEVEKAVTKKGIADKLKWEWPIPEPEKTLKEIVDSLETKIDEEAKEEFPETERLKFQKEAEEMYRIYQTGDEVDEFIIRGGRGPNSKVRGGKLYQITPERVRIGDRWIVRMDLAEETQANFYPDVSEQFIKRYVTVENRKYDTKIDAFKDELRMDRYPAAFRGAGYVPKKSRYNDSKDTKNWVSRNEVVDHFYAIMKKNQEDALRPKITEDVFVANGYVHVTEQNQDEWMPKAEAEDWIAKLRRKASGGMGEGGEMGMGMGPGMEENIWENEGGEGGEGGMMGPPQGSNRMGPPPGMGGPPGGSGGMGGPPGGMYGPPRGGGSGSGSGSGSGGMGGSRPGPGMGGPPGGGNQGGGAEEDIWD